MSKTTTQRIITIVSYLIIMVLIVSLTGLVGWYFFLRSKTATIVSINTARGFGTAAPLFEGAGGSTYQNVLSNIAPNSSSTAPSVSIKRKPPQLWKISQNPVAGAGFVKSGASTMIYFVERATGYIFSADPETGELVRITNTLRPKIYEAFFTNNGFVIERSLDDAGNIVTFAGTLLAAPAKESATTTEALRGTLLERNIISLAVHPASPEIFYTTLDAKAGLVGTRTLWNGSKMKQVFSSNILDWRMVWLADGRLIITQKAADNTAGYSYEVSQTSVQKSLIGNVSGLTLLPRASSPAILYGASGGGTLSLWAKIDQKTPAVQLPLKTVADKCVWAPSKTVGKVVDMTLFAYCAVPQTLPDGDFLDQWYRGAVHTEDSWWKVDVKSGTAKALFSSAQLASLDVDRPTIDESGNYIAFINAADTSLWLLRLDLEGAATSTD